MLASEGISAKMVEVQDNSYIDGEICRFNPDAVVIEALWVVPDKMAELQDLHPGVEFVVLLHSNTPFLAEEMIAVNWIREYAAVGVTLAVNSRHMFHDVRTLLCVPGVPETKVVYLPDYYPVKPLIRRLQTNKREVHIGCYGAIRPLKNQLIQAVAAINFANKAKKILKFHVNGCEVDTGGQPILNNLRALFDGTPHSLVEDKWLNHAEFLHSLASIDIGMQVSFTETFDIVAADTVSEGIVTIMSPEVVWASSEALALPTNGSMIEDVLSDAWFSSTRVIKANHRGLSEFVEESKKRWLQFVNLLG
jgi:hypothetical protein